MPLAVNEGFAWAGVCKDGGQRTPGTGSLLVVQNTSGGDDSHINGALAVPGCERCHDRRSVGRLRSGRGRDRRQRVRRQHDVEGRLSRSLAPAGTQLRLATSRKRGANIVIYGNDGETQSGLALLSGSRSGRWHGVPELPGLRRQPEPSGQVVQKARATGSGRSERRAGQPARLSFPGRLDTARSPGRCRPVDRRDQSQAPG